MGLQSFFHISFENIYTTINTHVFVVHFLIYISLLVELCQRPPNGLPHFAPFLFGNEHFKYNFASHTLYVIPITNECTFSMNMCIYVKG